MNLFHIKDNNQWLALDPATGIINIDANTKPVISKMFTSLNPASGFAKIDHNNIAVVDAATSNITNINLTNTHTRIISSKKIGTGPLFTQTAGITWLPSNQTLYVASAFNKAIYSVDKKGNRKIVSGSDGNTLIGDGPPFTFPVFIAIADDNQTAYVTNVNPAKIYKLNLLSGDRSIIYPTTD